MLCPIPVGVGGQARYEFQALPRGEGTPHLPVPNSSFSCCNLLFRSWSSLLVEEDVTPFFATKTGCFLVVGCMSTAKIRRQDLPSAAVTFSYFSCTMGPPAAGASTGKTQQRRYRRRGNWRLPLRCSSGHLRLC